METARDKKKIRSPSFPFIGLREAEERARALYQAERRNPARPEVAAAHWGYSPKSSGAMQTIGALRAYGLLTGEGSVLLTERGVRLVLDDAGSPERAELLRAAALAPPVHARLWERYSADLPSDRSLRSFLVLDLGFNESSVELCLRNYRDSLALAGLAGAPAEAAEPPPPIPTAGPAALPPPPSSLTLAFPLLDGNRVEFHVHRKVGRGEAEQLRALFGLWLEKITRE